ncbi:MAG: aminotransferase class III-fold pyridoxal phosphate-dependent enzyme [Planctomycetes bacterium]|nr:aminotransferase class III-fold pyridoxal phosphate-dependent enzyme [Planctomycetota bacterium]
MDLLERRKKALGPSYHLFYDEPVHLVRGKGVWLWDAKGRKYLDCYNNVASVGHCHPDVIAALVKQASTLNTHTRYLHENVVELAEIIASKMPGELGVCIFVCTGTEANDLATRIARTATGNKGMLVSEYSYHGDSTLVHTLSTADSEDRPDWLSLFEPPCQYRPAFDGDDLLEDYVGSVHNAINALKQKNQLPAAIMIDSIFDCPGTIEAPKGYFQQVYKKVREAGGLVIADEVQSGYCRTGKWWGFAHDDVVPDIVTLGKPMGAGHPLAAVVTTPEIADKFANESSYFNTFGGNPVSTAVGKAVIDVIDAENILENVARIGAYTRSGLEKLLEKYDVIGDVRGRGLFLSMELVKDRALKTPDAIAAQQMANLMKDEGVILSTHGRYENTLKIRPPMVFNQDNADQLLVALDVCFGKL